MHERLSAAILLLLSSSCDKCPCEGFLNVRNLIGELNWICWRRERERNRRKYWVWHFLRRPLWLARKCKFNSSKHSRLLQINILTTDTNTHRHPYLNIKTFNRIASIDDYRDLTNRMRINCNSQGGLSEFHILIVHCQFVVDEKGTFCG